MPEPYLAAEDVPRVLRSLPGFLDLLGKALELAWWDGFHRGAFVTGLAGVVLAGAVYAIRRGAK